MDELGWGGSTIPSPIAEPGRYDPGEGWHARATVDAQTYPLRNAGGEMETYQPLPDDFQGLFLTPLDYLVPTLTRPPRWVYPVGE